MKSFYCHRHITVSSPFSISKQYLNYLPTGTIETQNIINIKDTFENAKSIHVPDDLILRDKYGTVVDTNSQSHVYIEMHVSVPITNTGIVDNTIIENIQPVFGMSFSPHNNKVHVSLRIMDIADLLDAKSVLFVIANTFGSSVHVESVVIDSNPDLDDGWLPIFDRLPDYDHLHTAQTKVLKTLRDLI